jgi:hypothetical protein
MVPEIFTKSFRTVEPIVTHVGTGRCQALQSGEDECGPTRPV